jgi:hypothetical protein
MSKAVYDEEELRATRARLSVKDDGEAKFMMKVLGGEVGDIQTKKPEGSGRQPSFTKASPLRRVVTAEFEETETSPNNRRYSALAAKKEPTYRERVKMDSQEADSDFKIKTWMQVLRSKFSFFGTPDDMVNKVFVSSKIDHYIQPLTKLVNKTRLIFPRNNINRNKRFKQEAPVLFAVLDTIRYWNVEKISSALARIQTHPRSTVVSDFVEIIREFYRPLIILDMIKPETHITKAVDVLQSIVQENSENFIQRKTADELVMLFNTINEDSRYRLYPFLLKYVSDVFVPYSIFFFECNEKILDFLRLSPDDIIQIADFNNASSSFDDGNTDNKAENTDDDDGDLLVQSVEGKTEDAMNAQVRPASLVERPTAVLRGLSVLDQLFPESGWLAPYEFPDMYHYFAKSISLKKNADLIDPENPMLQVLILMQILEELFYGFRSISFKECKFDLNEFLGIIDEWHKLIETSFERMFLTRLAEYAKLYYTPPEAKQKIYAMKVREELNWVARLFFLPSMEINAFSRAPFQKKDVNAIFPKTRVLRQGFTVIAAEIEHSLKAGGASAGASCGAINNPWDAYVFQVQNPLSKRLNMLLSKENRNNVSLIHYTLSVLTVLDYFLNNPKSWAYQTNTAKLFRASDNDGLVPASIPEISVDAEAIFKASIEKLKARQNAQNAQNAHKGQAE